jgi:hypothetical protein
MIGLTFCFVAALVCAVWAEMIGASWLSVTCVVYAAWALLMLTGFTAQRNSRPSTNPIDAVSKNRDPSRN